MRVFVLWLALTMDHTGHIQLHGQYWSKRACENDPRLVGATNVECVRLAMPKKEMHP